MIRAAVLAIFWSVFAVAACAQALTGLARVEADGSGLRDTWLGGTELVLNLTQGVPFRVFTLDAPARLVLDFSEADWSGVTAPGLIGESAAVREMRMGRFQPGWSRLVADLAAPMVPQDIAMAIDPATGAARLSLRLTAVSAEQFAARAEPPASANWQARHAPVDPAPGTEARPFRVVLDPGHGGVDPGAERAGLVEKEIMLDFGFVLRDLLRRAGIDVVMTRTDDRFVSLERRTAIAHQAGATLFVSLHADALSQGAAHGAVVYTLSDKATDEASALLAARHNRADILAGLDLTGADDEVTGVLLDLARQETEPRTEAFTQMLVQTMAQAGGPMNNKPWRKAGFSVLKSADIPSVLVEIGFLSSERDRKNIADPDWRAGMAAAIARAILAWRDADAARAQLVRQ